MNESIYIWLLSGILGLVNFLFWSRIKRIEKDIQDNKDKNENIEKNYISRFEEIHTKLNEVEKNIIKEIYDMKLLAVSRATGRARDHNLDTEGRSKWTHPDPLLKGRDARWQCCLCIFNAGADNYYYKNI